MKNTNNKILIHTHLGLGDHYICCGLVRFVIENSDYEKYYIGCKTKNAKNVLPLFDDLDKVELLLTEDDVSLYNKLPEKCDILRVGFDLLDKTKNFDVSFYEQVNLPLEHKREYFHINRNEIREEECFNDNAPDEDYIFVHNTSSVGTFDLIIDSDLPRVSPDNMEYNVSDYLKVIENAKEIHCLDSSFLNLIDLVCEKENMFFHKVKDTQHPSIDSSKWTTIEYTKEEIKGSNDA